MDAKKPWESKTILLNVIGGVLAAIAAFYPNASIASQYIQSHLAQIGMLWGVLGIIVRFLTKDQIVLSD